MYATGSVNEAGLADTTRVSAAFHRLQESAILSPDSRSQMLYLSSPRLILPEVVSRTRIDAMGYHDDSDCWCRRR